VFSSELCPPPTVSAALTHQGTTVCCGDDWYLNVSSAVPTLDVVRVVGQQEIKVDGCGSVSVDDGQTLFVANNPGADPLYVRFTPIAQQSGEQLIEIPGPEMVPRHPTDPSLLLIVPKRISRIAIGLRAGTHGGSVVAELFGPNPMVSATATMPLGITAKAQVMPAGAGLMAGGELHAQVILPARTYQTGPPAQGEPPPDPPFLRPAPLDFCVARTGVVQVVSSGQVIAGATVTVPPSGPPVVGPLPGTSPPPLPKVTATGTLHVFVPPGQSETQDVVVSVDH
jgi:hypothetical protein